VFSSGSVTSVTYVLPRTSQARSSVEVSHCKTWRTRRDSNSRPLPSEGSTREIRAVGRLEPHQTAIRGSAAS
jgi:hypothetical protein